MNAIGKRRLLKLAAFLWKLPRAKFNFRLFADEAGKPMREALRAGKTRCGTTACALGWAPVPFPRALGWRRDPYAGYGRSTGTLEVFLRETPTLAGFEAAAAFFRIEFIDAEKLFLPREDTSYDDGNTERLEHLPGDSTPKQVARHIERFVKRQEWA